MERRLEGRIGSHFLYGPNNKNGAMVKGRVKWFDTTKGYGFVVTDEGEGDVLLHANVLRNFGRSSVAEGAEIMIDIQETDRGRQVTEIHEIDVPEAEMEAEQIDEMRPTDLVLGSDVDAPLLPARVKWFDKSKGFGFVNIFGSHEDIFVHMEVLRLYGLSDLQPGEAVCVRIVKGPRGQMAAEIRSWDYAADEEPAQS